MSEPKEEKKPPPKQPENSDICIEFPLMMQEDPGLSLKDKKLSRKRFRGVSRQVLPAFRKRIRWGAPRRPFILYLPLPRAGLFPALQLALLSRTVSDSPVGDMRPLPVFPAGRSRAPCPPNLTGGRAPALIPFPLLPHFLPRACALPRDVLTPGFRPFLSPASHNLLPKTKKAEKNSLSEASSPRCRATAFMALKRRKAPLQEPFQR